MASNFKVHSLNLVALMVSLSVTPGPWNKSAGTASALKLILLEVKLAQQHRRNVVNSLIGEAGASTFVEMDGPCMQLSGIREFYSEAFLREYESCKNQGAVVTESILQAQPLEEILSEYKIDTVTYISADCEGCEFSFIKSFNFTKFDVQVFNYEDNTVARQYKLEIDQILKTHGFELVFEAGDRLFVRKSMGLYAGGHRGNIAKKDEGTPYAGFRGPAKPYLASFSIHQRSTHLIGDRDKRG